MRPSVPSRLTYWLWFGLAVILIFGMLAYLLWARSRGLIDWSELWIIERNSLVAGLINAAIGIAARSRWLKKRDAAIGYEKMMKSIAHQDGD